MIKKLTVLLLLISTNIFSQQIGKTTTEDYQAEFEKRASIYSIPEYNGDPVPVALLNIGITDQFVKHGTQEEMHHELGLDAEGIITKIEQFNS